MSQQDPTTLERLAGPSLSPESDVPDKPEPSAVAARDLEKRLEDRSATIGVIGLGYVGLPLVCAVGETGLSALGFDVDPPKVEQLNAGRSYIRHIPDQVIATLRSTGRLETTTNFARLREVDVIVICVPTPLSRHREPDLTFVVRTAETIAPQLRAGQLVILESTTYPGTTSDVLRPILESTGLRSGDDFFLAYSPEREDPGNTQFTTTRIPKIVGGDGPLAAGLATTFYSQFVDQTVQVSAPEVAEAAKLTENIFRAVNIALANELKLVFDTMGIDVWEVIDAAKTKPFGYMAFYPGPGLGGHCIPIDPFYLSWKAREFDITTRFIELAGEINAAMPRYVVERLARALDDKFAKGLRDASVLILGIAYKKNVDDMRESPALAIMELLEARQAKVAFHDPFFETIPTLRDHPGLIGRRSIDLTPEVIGTFDAVLVVTDHDAIDYQALVDAAVLVVDTRNATRSVEGGRDKIVFA